MQPTVLMFHWTFGIGLIQSLYLACINPPPLIRAVYTGATLVNTYHYGLSAQLHEPSRQTMRLYVPDDEQRTIFLSRVAKWTSRGLHVFSIAMDMTYIVLITDTNVWLSMMMFIAVAFYPALKLLRRCAPEINTTLAQRLLKSRNEERRPTTQNEYSLLDDNDYNDAVRQRFMLKQVPRMLAMIALCACHMALMLDVRDTCAYMKTMNTTNAWLC